jgi:rubrerythrin
MDDRLKEAFHKIYEGEAKAALRLQIFGKKADQEDLPKIAKLFRVIAFSEEIHGERALRMLKEIKDTDTHLILKTALCRKQVLREWLMRILSSLPRK